MTHETGDVRQVIERWTTAVRDYAYGVGNVGTLMKYGADLVDALESLATSPGAGQQVGGLREWRGECQACHVQIAVRSSEDWALEFSIQCPGSCGATDVLLTSAGVVAPQLASQPAPSGWQQRIADAARALVTKLDAVHSNASWQGAMVTAYLHGHRYDGPTYSEELEALRNAVDVLPPAPEVKDAIADAVRAELQPLEDALIDAGHKLAKETRS